MSYSVPPLSTPIVLTAGYAPPPLSTPIVLCQQAGATITVALYAGLPAPSPSLSMAASVSMGRGMTIAAGMPSAVAPALSLAASVSMGRGMTIAAGMPAVAPALSLAAGMTQDLALPDADGPGARLMSRQGERADTRRMMASAEMLRTRGRAWMPHQHGGRSMAGVTLPHAECLRQRRPTAQRHQHGIRTGGGARLPHAECLRQRRPTAQHHQHGIRAGGGARLPHAEKIRTRTRADLWEQQALTTALRLSVRERQALRITLRRAIREQQMIVPPPGRWWPRYVAPGLTIRTCCAGGYVPRPLLVPVLLTWTYVAWPHCDDVPPEQHIIIIPVRRVYRVQNSVSLVRASDAAPVPALSLSLSLDVDSWAWSFSAALPGAALALVRVGDAPQELIATVNGHAVHLVIDSISRSRSFGATSITVSGRGRAAALASPTAAPASRYNTETRTAQQLLADALTENGVPIGWAVDWGLEDWSVPAGAWSHAGTYIEAATAIAAAGGGYVQGHDTARTLHIRPYYPAPPWDWEDETPDIELPEAICTTEQIEWIERPAYNAVFVVGGAGGRRDYIRRAGTDGMTMAPTEVDGLATDVVMTRQRGIRVLGDTGRQALISIKTPVIAGIGIIKPGRLIRYVEGGAPRLGLSRAVSVDCQFPTVAQTIRIETHV